MTLEELAELERQYSFHSSGEAREICRLVARVRELEGDREAWKGQAKRDAYLSEQGAAEWAKQERDEARAQLAEVTKERDMAVRLLHEACYYIPESRNLHMDAVDFLASAAKAVKP